MDSNGSKYHLHSEAPIVIQMKPSKPKNNGAAHHQDCCVSRHLINSLLSKQLKGILNLDGSNEISSSIDKIDSN